MAKIGQTSAHRKPPISKDYGRPEITVRALVLMIAAAILAATAWRYPVVANPLTIGLAAFVVLDRLTRVS